MKLVTAIIQPDNLDAVREELIGAGISRITASRCTGRGNAEAVDLYRGQQVAPGLIPKVRLEIAVNQEFVRIAIDAIVKGARTGLSAMVRFSSPRWTKWFESELVRQGRTLSRN